MNNIIRLFFAKTEVYQCLPWGHGVFRYRPETRQYYSCPIPFNIAAYILYESWWMVSKLPVKKPR